MDLRRCLASQAFEFKIAVCDRLRGAKFRHSDCHGHMIQELLKPVALQSIGKAGGSEQLLDLLDVFVICHVHPRTPTTLALIEIRVQLPKSKRGWPALLSQRRRS